MTALDGRLRRIEDVVGCCPRCGGNGPVSIGQIPEWKTVVTTLVRFPDALAAVKDALRDPGP